VSGGKCESLFIGGFSGSGKSRLINKLTDQVDAVGGYVLSHKFDQMLSKGRSMLEIVALFNGLCLLIIEKNTKPDVLALVDDLIGFFGPDLSSLARLLPNIKILASHLNIHVVEQESDSQTNVRSICFTLQRFIGVVSSAAHPVVLFLDDLQWCDDSVLTVVESIFNDASKSNCLFFVGTYRSNEVADDHEIFRSAKRLKSSGVPTTMMSLEGLQPNDLNTMISDALCVFPRICEPLSDIVFQKTKGNPFFVLAFLRSLADRGLLKYCVNARRWLWDEDDVSSMDVTGNVLQLLSFNMSGLSLSVRSALKTAACFGIKIDQGVIKTLAANPEHADIHNLLEEVVNEGFMVKVGSTHYRFVHDKVREAAYSLIPDEERDQVSIVLFAVYTV
jgi:predicted ATPase